MLILTRRTGEVVHIGDEVKVTILAIVGDRVRVGFDAPRSIAVDRAEVVARKREGLRQTQVALEPLSSEKLQPAR